MYILILILGAILFRSAFDVLVSRTGGKIDDNLSNTIVNIAAALTAVLPLLYLKAKNSISIPTTATGMTLSISAGIAVGIFTLFLIKAYAKGGLVYTTPVVYGGTIILASVIGAFFFKESVTPIEVIGLLAVLIGIGLVIYAKATGM